MLSFFSLQVNEEKEVRTRIVFNFDVFIKPISFLVRTEANHIADKADGV